MTKIYIETEEYKSEQGDFYVFKLTGDTYNAKEIIKAAGFQFTDVIGYGKGWRTPVIFKRDFVPGNAEFAKIQGMLKDVRAKLTECGHELCKR